MTCSSKSSKASAPGRTSCARSAEAWRDELGEGAVGWLGGTYGFTDDDDFFGVVRFESREAAMANSARPEQGAWAEKMIAPDGRARRVPRLRRRHVVPRRRLGRGRLRPGDPAARSTTPSRIKAMLADTGDLHEMRPEIIGGTLRDRRRTGPSSRRSPSPTRRAPARASRWSRPTEVAGRAGVDDGRRDVLRPAPALVRVGLTGPHSAHELRRPRRRLPAVHGPVLRSRSPSSSSTSSPYAGVTGCSTWAAVPGVLTAPLVDRCGAASGRRRSTPRRRSSRPPATRFPGVDVREADGRGPAVRRRHLRRRPGAAGRALHDRPRRRAARDGPGDQAGRQSVAASVWDYAGGTAPLSVFWQAAHEIDPAAPGRGRPRRARARAHLAELAREAGLARRPLDLADRPPPVRVVRRVVGAVPPRGRARRRVRRLPRPRRIGAGSRQRCRELLPEPPFEHAATAWVVLAEAAAR